MQICSLEEGSMRPAFPFLNTKSSLADGANAREIQRFSLKFHLESQVTLPTPAYLKFYFVLFFFDKAATSASSSVATTLRAALHRCSGRLARRGKTSLSVEGGKVGAVPFATRSCICSGVMESQA